MSLISLLIALAAERTLKSPFWQFNTVFTHYVEFFNHLNIKEKLSNSSYIALALLLMPVAAIYLLLSLFSNELIHFVLSTIILIVCFGCVGTRDCYKKYLKAAYLGESTTSDLHYQQLISDKNLSDVGFGQTLIWLNYRYYVAIMLFFVVFGAPGAVFYRLLCTLDEKQRSKIIAEEMSEPTDTEGDFGSNEEDTKEVEAIDDTLTSLDTDFSKVLFFLDWIPVRITSFGFMLVGHFSKAMPVWLENAVDTEKGAQDVLIDVAHKAEDIMIDMEDCTAEPCLLVRLAKRNLLMMLAILAVLTLMGIIS